MFTLHTSSHLRFVRGELALSWVLLAITLAAQAQTQADCTFNFLSTKTQFKHQDGTPVFMQPLGINDFRTIVGYAIYGTATGDSGLIRWANGGFTRVKGTSALVARNDRGTSLGYASTGLFQAILANGTTITPIVLGGNKILYGIDGINRWSTIVGTYHDNSGFPSTHGFKRWNNGTIHTLDFPGATPSSTSALGPQGINDNGTVVGQYDDKASLHGFIFHNGQWATLDYPQAVGTNLIGITNAGKIIGKARITTPWSDVLFLYEKGTFKVISVPNSVAPELLSISPKQGLILGFTDGSPGSPAFIAQCQ